MSKLKKIILIIAACVVVAAAAALIIFSCVKHNIHRQDSAANPPAQLVDFSEKDDDVIRIMSFNIRYGGLGVLTAADRYEMVEETIRKSQADSFGVQEATPSWMRYLKKALADKYDYVGVGRDNGKNMGEYSAVFYLKDKYKAVDSGTFWLSETPDTPSKGWDASCKRVCTWIVLEDILTGEKYVHINAHFDHKGQAARINSVDMIVEKAKQYSDLPVVFTADMNIEEGNDLYKRMIDSNVLRDTKYEAEDTMDYLTFHNMIPSAHEESILDYVMINDRFEAEAYRVVTAGIDDVYVSDHFPVYADIEFNK